MYIAFEKFKEWFYADEFVYAKQILDKIIQIKNSHPNLKKDYKYSDLIYPEIFSLTCSGQPIAICEYLYNIAQYGQTHITFF